jgi:hypothetical protein
LKKVLIAAVAALASGGTAAACGSLDVSRHGAAAPYLSALAVSAETPLTLVPSFSPGVYDYYVRCAAGTNALTISMTAFPGAESALREPETSEAMPQQTLSVNVKENQAIVAIAIAGTATTEYWVRCLPHDFPYLQMSAHANVPSPGYYLVGNRQRINGAQPYAMVLNGYGVPVWYFHDTRGEGVVNVDNIRSGAISFVAQAAEPVPYEIHKLRPWETTYVDPGPGTALDDHELRALSNGHFLILSNPILGGVDLTGIRIPDSSGGVLSFGANSYILNCNILEIDAKGNVAWTWVGSDHIDALRESTFPILWNGTAPDGSPVVDPLHCNSIDVDPANGNLLVSARDMDAIFYIERSTGTILWKMGGRAYSKDHAPYVPVGSPFYRQHDARLLPGWSPTCNGGTGQISVFDDQTNEPGPARAVVYDVVVGASDGGTPLGCKSGEAPRAKVAWEFKGQAIAYATGSFRISADGSRVIDWGIGPVFDLVFTEVDAEGHDLLDFYFADNNTSARTVKVPLSAFDLEVLRRTAGASSDTAANDGGSDRPSDSGTLDENMDETSTGDDTGQ